MAIEIALLIINILIASVVLYIQHVDVRYCTNPLRANLGGICQ